MKAFLEQVAQHYWEEGNIDKNCFIFPNRRSLLFFNKYLSTFVAERKKAIRVPKLLTINDFFLKLNNSKHKSIDVADRVTLLLELYDSYKEVYKSIETLDDFIFWGDMIIADFNDLDKYNINVKSLFSNLSDLNELQDDLSYLTDEQKNALESFLRLLNNHKSEDSATIKFKSFWSKLFPLYENYNKRLEQKGLAYEGRIYRNIVNRLSDEESVIDLLKENFGSDKYIFVGLNALSTCEKIVLDKCQKAKVAEFIWDYCSDMIKDEQNKSSLLLSENISQFPNAFNIEYDKSFIPEINVVNISSSLGQVKIIPKILDKIAKDKYNGDLSKLSGLTDCAIVLPDEILLPGVLNTIPFEIKDINVTMGFPMIGSEFYVLVMNLIQCQLNTYKRDGEYFFQHKNVQNVISNAVIKNALGEEDKNLLSQIKQGLRYYVNASEFQKSELLSKVFRPIPLDATSSDKEQLSNLQDYLIDVIKLLAPLLTKNPNLSREMDFGMICYSCLNNLKRKNLEVQPKTYKVLLSRLLLGQDVHFKGEPLKGLQIMGPLETRALDFSNLIVLSCNEGMLPRKSLNASFIPANLRLAFNLPTYEYQDSVWAYYFYRMIQRPEKVWLIVDSRSGIQSVGEESRYIKQLKYHFDNVKVNRYSMQPTLLVDSISDEIQKPKNIAEIVKGITFSPSSLKNYLTCQARFYYDKIVGLKVEDEILDNIDSRVLGNVYHATMQALYLDEEVKAMAPDFDMSPEHIKEAVAKGEIKRLKTVSLDRLRSLKKDEEAIRKKVRSLMQEELKREELRGENLVVEKIIVKYILKTLEVDIELLNKSSKGSFDIIDLETEGNCQIAGYNFHGFLDRLDSFEDNTIRVVDYKTGSVTEKELNITEKNYEKTIASIFDYNANSRNLIAVQLYVYDKFIKKDPKYRAYNNRTIINSIYSVRDIFSDDIYNSTMLDKFIEGMDEQMDLMFKDMVDVNKPFRRTSKDKDCQYCDFKNICGK